MSTISAAEKKARRSFLKAVGATAAALPFYKLLEGSAVHAQTGTRPLGFVGFGLFHGTAAPHYARRANETDTDFSLRHPDSPFSPFDDATTYGTSFKSRVSIFEGFDHGVGEWDAGGNPTHVPFHGAMGQVLTGSSPGRQGSATVQNASLDQMLAEKHGNDTRFRSVRLRGLDQIGYDLDANWLLSFGTGGAPLTPIEQPNEIWDTYFKNAIVGADPAAQAAAARKQAIGASVLDFVVQDINRLNGRLGAAEKQKLDQHLTVVRSLERRLKDQAGPSGAGGCRPPSQRPRTYDKFKDGEVIQAFELQIDMFAELFACGMTRFGSFVLPNELGPGADRVTDRFTGGTVPISAGTEADPIYYEFHNQVAHRYLAGTTELAVYSQQRVAAINRFYFSRIARFMRRLHESGVLDSTVILMGGEGGETSLHDTHHLPLLVAGGANGKLTLGKRVVHPQRSAQVGQFATGVEWTSINPVLAALANLWGENLDSFGTCKKAALTLAYSGALG